jgi:hypothetical protein
MSYSVGFALPDHTPELLKLIPASSGPSVPALADSVSESRCAAGVREAA